MSDEAFEELKQALYRHKMIYLRDQHLTHAEHEAFGARLGPFAVDAYTQGVRGHREVHPIIKEADTRSPSLFGGGWHTDSPFLDEPPAITTLRAVEVPPFGGDTSWANCALAFRHLEQDLPGHAAPAARAHVGAQQLPHADACCSTSRSSSRTRKPSSAGLEGRYHPLVRAHPETGEESLYICDTYTVGFEGMTTAEAKPIVDFLVAHCTQAAFTCRLRWTPGTVALWDNRAAMHLGPNDYDGYRREMYRTTTAGGKVEAAA